MKRKSLLLAGVLAYLLFMLILTPAAWWLKLAPLPAGLHLGPVSGNLWQGQINGVQYQQYRLPELRWTLSGWRLLTGKLQFHLQSGSVGRVQQPYLDGVVSYGFGGVTLHNSFVKLPVAPLVPLLTLPLPVEADGALVLDIPSFRQGQPWCEDLIGSASWQNARLQTPTGTWLELQNLFGALSCASGTIVLVTDQANLLGLDVKVVINAEQLLVNGTLKPDAGMPAEVHEAMRFVGQPDSEGRYRISF